MSAWVISHVVLDVGNALNAERQWRPVTMAHRALRLRCRERTKRRKAMETSAGSTSVMCPHGQSGTH